MATVNHRLQLLFLIVVRICIVYDCLYPYTIGGAERWYRNLALRLAADGHDVTYLTLRQWEPGERGVVPGVRVVEAGRRMALYTDGRRRILPPLVFGASVLAHLAVHGRSYDVVYTGSFPYFSLLAAALVRRWRGFTLGVDWIEVWTRAYWRQYLGPAGDVGWFIQRLCIRVPQRAFCLSELHAQRLRASGQQGFITVHRGLYDGPAATAAEPLEAEPVVVFAGRHIPEKRVPAIVPAIERARAQLPDLRCVIFGDGPDRPTVLRQIAAAGLEAVVAAPGFVGQDEVEHTLERALCLLLPSLREGYGLVVVEAAAKGVPSVVVAGADNAATELIEEGVNGFIAASASPQDLADAIERVHAGGSALRASTAGWFRLHAAELSLTSSLDTVSRIYAGEGRS